MVIFLVDDLIVCVILSLWVSSNYKAKRTWIKKITFRNSFLLLKYALGIFCIVHECIWCPWIIVFEINKARIFGGGGGIIFAKFSKNAPK